MEDAGVFRCATCMICECAGDPGTKAKHFVGQFSSTVMAGGSGSTLHRLLCVSHLNNSSQILSLRSRSGNHCPHFPGLDRVLRNRLAGIR